MHRGRRAGVAALAGLALLLADVSAARAQAPPAAGDEASQAQARALHQRGMAAYDLGNFDEAIEAFRQAYQLAPAPGLLFNLAQAQRAKGEPGCADALRSYRAYLRALPEASNRDLVSEQIAEMERCVAATERRQAAASSAPPPAPAASPSAATGSWAPPWPAIALGATGLAALGVGTGLYVSSSNEFDRLRTECPARDCDPEQWGSYRTREQVGVALLTVGGALVLGGALYWIVTSGSSSSTPRTGLARGWQTATTLAF
jgi:tetratricopeptide (TPR) repeat protein